MTELIRSNDIVLIGFVRSLLEGAQIPLMVADEHMSLMEGSIGAFPRRLLVPDDHANQARRILTDAGLAAELRDSARG
ncbi:putative signal transducing protein [Methylobacterium sp. Leaf118]|uniref:putative signal transducing protein n=1 Tax=Methylobacterium sp. Leaf118 TaxID=2876562 RepID=UPI001E6184AE|nr:DUF2007 domain-containing protein [Methylobacterium sp. Leaf118]